MNMKPKKQQLLSLLPDALVQTNAMKAWNTDDGNFKQNLLSDANVKKHLTEQEIEDCFKAENYLGNLDKVFDRVGV